MYRYAYSAYHSSCAFNLLVCWQLGGVLLLPCFQFHACFLLIGLPVCVCVCTTVEGDIMYSTEQQLFCTYEAAAVGLKLFCRSHALSHLCHIPARGLCKRPLDKLCSFHKKATKSDRHICWKSRLNLEKTNFWLSDYLQG